MTDQIDKITQLASSAVGRIRVKSALNPLLVLCAIGMPTCLISAGLLDASLAKYLVFAAISMPLLTVLCFVYFMLVDPDKLQSEDYQIRKAALELIEEKGGRLPLYPASIDTISNPDRRALPPSTEEVSDE
ncbi:MAG: hypothetical protein KF838_00970 [Phycisphaeraceae bacterium]|nr:MAG: hypothetical protein KF838_00970 [Phycisphaeraceae bacterium]